MGHPSSQVSTQGGDYMSHQAWLEAPYQKQHTSDSIHGDCHEDGYHCQQYADRSDPESEVHGFLTGVLCEDFNADDFYPGPE